MLSQEVLTGHFRHLPGPSFMNGTEFPNLSLGCICGSAYASQASNTSNSFFHISYAVYPAPRVLCFAPFDVFYPLNLCGLASGMHQNEPEPQVNCSNSAGTIVVRKFEVISFDWG